MTIDTVEQEIIQRDYAKNHSSRDYTLEQVLKIFNNLESTGFSRVKYGPVIIVYKPYTVDTVEFHCTNGGNRHDLVSAVNQFNEDMSDTYWWSVTFYDNEKINPLLELAAAPSMLRKIDSGIDKTYEAMFKLRSE